MLLRLPSTPSIRISGFALPRVPVPRIRIVPSHALRVGRTDSDASRIKMHLKLSGIDGRFQEAITRTLELVEEQDRSLEYFRSDSAGYQSDVPTCE